MAPSRAARCIVALALTAAFEALAQAPAPNLDQLTKEAQYPAPVNTFEIELGHKTNYRQDGKNETYRRITYKGSLVRSEGTPFKYATGLDLAAPPIPAGAGDRNKLAFRYEEGSARVGGGLFEAMGVEPFNLRAIEGLDLRGTAFVGGDTNGKILQAAVGVETPPTRLPLLKDTLWSNWLVFGVNAQRQEATDSETDDRNFGLLTYRAFVGKAFGWRKRGDVATNARKIADDILRKVPTLAQAKTLAAQLEKNVKAGQRLASWQQLIYDAATDATSDATWESTVRKLALGDSQAVAEEPTYAVYFESSGWYTAGRPFEGSRFKNLFMLTADYWPVPQRTDIFLRARYESGYERATPTERKNQLIVSVGLKF